MSIAEDPVADHTQMLTAQAGGYLRNVIRERFVTCAVCTAPVKGWERCLRCDQHSSDRGAADLVVPLVYGVERTQSATLLRHYKDDISGQARARYSRLIRRLLYVGLMKHQPCIEMTVGQRVNARVTVPSLSGRRGVHPFTAIARAMNAVDDRLTLTAAPQATPSRTVTAGKFTIAPHQALRGKHILVLDDTWTTGANTQSAALTLRRAGARQVSVLVIGRWLSPTNGTNADFIAQRLQHDYDPDLCPVTGGECPLD